VIHDDWFDIKGWYMENKCKWKSLTIHPFHFFQIYKGVLIETLGS
jgi:hypothetical protein